MLATVGSATVFGVEGRAVHVEVHVSNGLPGFTIVGLPDTSCREARDRVRAALLSSGLKWPQRRVTVNLAPSGVRKAGAGLDLAIAIGILIADDQITADAARDRAFVGELGLDGTLRGVPGIVPLLDAMHASEIVLPMECVVPPDDLEIVKYRGVSSLCELVMALEGKAPWPVQPEFGESVESSSLLDLADVVGQPVPRIAIELAAAGRHHLLLVGPPGAGKTLLASRLPGILPALNAREARAVARIYSAAGVSRSLRSVAPPFRAPHHGASTVSLVGGGTSLMRPGEISLACHGVLFLDELGEFSVTALESLRQPLERGSINISRASATATLPADFLLVAAMNPCPCGQDGAPGDCRCSDAARQRYSRRLSGPLMDRFDLRVIVGRADPVQLLAPPNGEESASVLERVKAARSRAEERGVRANAELSPRALEDHCTLGAGANDVLQRLLSKNDLTARGLHRVRTVALTMADLAGEAPVLTRENLVLATSLRAPVSQLMGGS